LTQDTLLSFRWPAEWPGGGRCFGLELAGGPGYCSSV
jgi:hypothetical protein